MISPIHAMLASTLMFGGVSAAATDHATRASHENRGLSAEEKADFAERRAAFRSMTAQERKVAGRGRWNKAPRGKSVDDKNVVGLNNAKIRRIEAKKKHWASKHKK